MTATYRVRIPASNVIVTDGLTAEKVQKGVEDGACSHVAKLNQDKLYEGHHWYDTDYRGVSAVADCDGPGLAGAWTVDVVISARHTRDGARIFDTVDLIVEEEA